MKNENLNICDWCGDSTDNAERTHGNYVKFANTNMEQALLCDDCAEGAFSCQLSTCGKLGDRNTTGYYGDGYCSHECQHTCTTCGGVDEHSPNCET